MLNKDWKNLKVGDKIRIVAIPGFDENGKKIKGYTIYGETITAYKKLIARKRPVRIYEIDEWGNPWFQFRFKERDEWHTHIMAIFKEDDNWVRVKTRK